MNQEFAIESFISFCDDMMITEEGFNEIKDKVWTGIKNVWAKIVTWFKNMLLNVNRFKNATLDSTQNSDMVKILKMSQVGTERYFNLLNSYYKSSNSLSKYDGEHMISKLDMGESQEPGFFHPEIHTSIEDQAEKISTEIRNALDSTKNSSEYKRFTENSYDNKDMKTIPLGNITSELQLCNKMSTKFQGELTNMEKCDKKVLEHRKGAKLVDLMHRFLNQVVQYYTFRINILTKFFINAKASLKGTINNIKESINDRESVKTNRKPSMFMITKPVLLGNNFGKVKKLYADALGAQTYEEYAPIYKKLIGFLKCPGYIVEECKFNAGSKSCVLKLIKDSTSKMPISPTQKLFHSFENEGKCVRGRGQMPSNLSELTPSWKTASGGLFPEPRVYFHLNVPRNRYSGSKNMGGVYVPKTNPSEVYVDKELGSTAVFVKTTKPIPVKKIDLEEFKKNMDVKLGLAK